MTIHEDNLSSNLCTSCGLCCDGTLYKRAPLVPEDDREALEENATEVVVWEGEDYLALPCPANDCGVCQMYSIRPTVCRSYKCKLLKRALENKISWKASLDIVHTTRLYKEKLDSRINEYHKAEHRTSLSERFHDFIDSHKDTEQSSAFKQKYKKIMAEYVALNLMLDRHFREKKEAFFLPELAKRPGWE